MAPKKIILTVFLLCQLVSSTSLFAATPKEALNKAAHFFDRGDYKKALLELNAIELRRDFDNSEDMKLVLKIRVISYGETDEEGLAAESIRELFFLDPDYKFDPFDTPRSVVEIAKREKDAILEKNQHLASIKSSQLAEAHPLIEEGLKPAQNIVSKPTAGLSAWLPLGFNHFSLGAKSKGFVYLSLQTLSVATNITAFWWKQSYLDGFGSSRLKKSVYQESFENIQVIQYIGLGAMILSYTISVIDALAQINRGNTDGLNF